MSCTFFDLAVWWPVHETTIFLLVTLPNIRFKNFSLAYLAINFLISLLTRSSAIAEGLCDVSCQLKSCHLQHNSAETTFYDKS